MGTDPRAPVLGTGLASDIGGEVGIMETSIFLKRLIFGLTTGSLFFYLVSFHSVGQTQRADAHVRECRAELLKIRSGRPVALRYQKEVTTENVLQLSNSEQKMITQYIKTSGYNLVDEGVENPFLVTTYRMESPTRKLLGYKIVVDTLQQEDDVMTFYLTKNHKLVFWYLEAANPLQNWACKI